jgi:hypothetical protein
MITYYYFLFLLSVNAVKRNIVQCSSFNHSLYHLSKNRRISDSSSNLKTQLLKSLDLYDEANAINSNFF